MLDRHRGSIFPVPGYSGFIPGLASGNKHGETYGAILNKDSVRETKPFRSMRSRSNCPVPCPSTPTFCDAPPHFPSYLALKRSTLCIWNRSATSSPTTTQTFGRATALGLIREGAPIDVPVVGYMGFMPRWYAANMHGGTWRNLLSPAGSPTGSRRGSPESELSFS